VQRDDKKISLFKFFSVLAITFSFQLLISKTSRGK